MADVVVIDKDTYAADHERLEGWPYELVQKDICDDVAWACEGADYIVNFAAESHVDNSIKGYDSFISSNVQLQNNSSEDSS